MKFIIEKIKDLNGNFDKIVKTQTFHPDCFCREKMVWEEDFYVGGSPTKNVAKCLKKLQCLEKFLKRYAWGTPLDSFQGKELPSVKHVMETLFTTCWFT